MKKTIHKRITAAILAAALLFSVLSVPASAFGDIGGVIPFDYTGDFGALRYWFDTAPEAKELPSEEFLNDRAKDFQDDIVNAGKAGTNYKIADIVNKLAPKAAPSVGRGLLQLSDKLNAINKSMPLFSSNLKTKIWLNRGSEYFKGLSKTLPDVVDKYAHGIGFGVDAFFAAKGFYDMYENPRVGFDSPFLEWAGNSFRGMSSSASLLYRLTDHPWAGYMAAGFTAVDVAFNSKTMVNTMNRLTKGKRIPLLDDFADLNNEWWRTAWDYYLGLIYNPEIDKNNKLADEMMKKCRGATFQGSGVGVYKPNTYLYPADDTDVCVTFAMPDLLTVTDPPYESGWSVRARPDGTLTSSAGEYGYLFYESITDPAAYQRTEGYVIPAEKRDETFRDILTQYGLNEQEINDFCEFWCTKLDEGKAYAMYPQTTETIDKTMPVTLSPAPDTALRIWFAFAENELPEAEAKPERFDREGFTMIEWGGFFFDS